MDQGVVVKKPGVVAEPPANGATLSMRESEKDGNIDTMFRILSVVVKGPLGSKQIYAIFD